jgi:hypothetical protein
VARHYCCYFDHRYLPKGLAMIRSLRQFEPEAAIWVLCFDQQCHQLMSGIGEANVRLVTMSEFEADDEPLRRAKQNRGLVEYYFTCTPSLVRFVLQHCAPGDTVTYVDGDLYFFSSPLVLHQEAAADSVALISHRFIESQREREIYGRYNVGWLTFRADEAGRAAVAWWRERCNEWCYDRVEGDRFADQKYLDRMPGLFQGVRVLANEGANVAPWNVARYEVTERAGRVYVRPDVPLVFFHFHGLKASGAHCYLTGLREYGASASAGVKRCIYRPYIGDLRAIERALARSDYRQKAGLQRGSGTPPARTGGFRRAVRNMRALARRDALVVVAGRVL